MPGTGAGAGGSHLATPCMAVARTVRHVAGGRLRGQAIATSRQMPHSTSQEWSQQGGTLTAMAQLPPPGPAHL